MHFVTDYKHDIPLRLSFNHLARQVFGIDFEEWYQRGCWDDNYICYSMVDGGQVVANVSVSKMRLLLEGRIHNALQIGAVMTHPDYRSQGLSRQLLETVLAEHEQDYDFVYLYANSSVLDFYPKFGFKPVRQNRITAQVRSTATQARPARRLDMSNPADWELTVKLVRQRKPLYTRCSALGADSIFAWHCLNEFPQDIYYVEEQELLVVCRKEEGVVHIADVVGRGDIRLADFIDALPFAGQLQVEFGFTPGFADVEPLVETLELDPDDTFFIRPAAFLLPEGVRFPLTART